MHRLHKNRLIALLILGLVALLIVSPIYSQGNGNGKGKGKGRNQNQEQDGGGQQSQPEPNISQPQLGCQKNNPSRLDCSSLEVTGYCEGTTAVFVIRNTGEAGNGDMRAPTQYRLYQNDVLVESGSVQINGSATMEIRYSGGGSVRLEADQQVGHPGNSRPRVTLNCGAPTEPPTPEVTPTEEITPTQEVTPTPEPTEEVTPTPEPTEEITPTPEPTEEITPTPEPTEEVTPTPEPTEEVLPPDLWVDGVCVDENYVAFTITNNGGTMPEPFYYEINDVYGNIIAADWLQLYSGESIVVEVSAVNAPVTINIHNWTYYATSACASTTPEVEQPDLWVDGVCLDGFSVAFTITNNGSDMLDPVYYEVTDMYGGVIYQDWLQLFSGESITLELGMIPGPVTINIDNWTYYTTVDCISTTPEVEQPDLWVDGVCLDGGSVAFMITNNGSDMLNPVYYEIYDMYGGVIYQDWVQLFSGESITLELGMIPGPVTINIDNWTYYTTVECISVTPEVEQPDLWADAYCTDVGGVVFVITNNGGDMADPEYYTVTDMNGVVIYQDWVQLFSGESITVEVGMVSGPVYLDVGNGLAYTSIECYVPTPEPTPTEEVTPEPTPTEEVTPEPTPTEEVTPEPTPTEEVTPEPTPTLVPPVLGCQKNNPARLDCSSLEVTATCEGGVAVFTIRNTGEPGNGDMLAPTEYRLYVGNTLVESGSVQIDGGTTMQVRYDGGGRVRLEADQQVGHPGNSRPRETITCR